MLLAEKKNLTKLYTELKELMQKYNEVQDERTKVSDYIYYYLFTGSRASLFSPV